MAKREERGMPSQVHVLREYREMHVSEAEPCTTGTNQYDGPVSGSFSLNPTLLSLQSLRLTIRLRIFTQICSKIAICNNHII